MARPLKNLGSHYVSDGRKSTGRGALRKLHGPAFPRRIYDGIIDMLAPDFQVTVSR